MTEQKIDLAAFREQALGEAALAEERRRAAEAVAAENARLRLEARGCVAVMLMNVARLSSRFNGFPSEIDVSSHNGYNKGLVVRREDGLWRLAGTPQALSSAAQGGPFMGLRTDAVGRLLEAVGIPHSPEAVKRLLEVGAWSPDPATLRGQVAEAAATLPRHVWEAALCEGTNFFRGLDLKYQPDVAAAFIGGFADAGFDVADLSGGNRPLIQAALKDDSFFAAALLRAGARVNGKTPDGTAPVAAAVANGHGRTFDLLRGAGAFLKVIDNEGRGLLHVAADGIGFGSDPRGAAELFEVLLACGLDPAREDRRRKTPMDALVHAGDICEGADDYDERKALLDRVVSKLEEIVGPRWRRR
jgi:hypothetical protein